MTSTIIQKETNIVPNPRVYIRRWNSKSLINAFVAVLQGKRRSGKSCLAKELMKKTSHMFSGGVLFSGTEKLTPYLGQFMHKNVVHDGLNIPMFKALVNNRVDTIGEYNVNLSKEQIGEDKKNLVWSTLIILEDCLKNYAQWKSIGATFDLFFNGRHAQFGLLLLSQEAKCIPPPCRGNVEYLFLFQENNPRNLEVIYEEYCKFIPKAVFYQLMEKVGKQYHCIVIDFNVKSSNAWQDKVFWYKSELDDDEKPFRFGSQASWDYNDYVVKQRAVAIYERMKKEQQEKKEMAEWIAKLSEERKDTNASVLKRKLGDRYF